MIEPKIFPKLSAELVARLTKQATADNDEAAYRTLMALSKRPVTFKVRIWPSAKGAGVIEMGVN